VGHYSTYTRCCSFYAGFGAASEFLYVVLHLPSLAINLVITSKENDSFRILNEETEKLKNCEKKEAYLLYVKLYN
jgi:hypothetical protein